MAFLVDHFDAYVRTQMLAVVANAMLFAGAAWWFGLAGAWVASLFGALVQLRVFKRLLDADVTAHLTCFGCGPPAWLLQAIAKMGLSRSVSVVDNGQSGNFAAEYEAMLRSHDVVLAPSVRSRSDEGGLALTLVMAQAAGKPVIVSDFPGAERAMDDGRDGPVVPGGDVDALFCAMARLAKHPEQWQPLRHAGRERVLRAFSDAAYWANLQGCYRAAAAGR